MSELLKRYEESNKVRPTEARQIPDLAVNMFDTTQKFQEGFTTFAKKGDTTKFTKDATGHFDVERKEIVIPTNFVPTEQGIPLARWTPDNPYHKAGIGSK